MNRTTRPTSTLPRNILAATLLVSFCSLAAAQTAPAADAPADKAGAQDTFMRMDENADGKVSREEAARMPEIGDKFDVLDKDRDGFLSPDEVEAGQAATK
ncbi:MAG: hypothetical protein ABIQ60_04855 [Burkholderiaceae bacterium]